MSNEITKDNIAEVLEFNNIDQHRYKIDDDTIACFTDVNGKWIGTTILYVCPEWLKIVELYFGKLKPLPKANPFDVVKVGDWVKSKKTLYHYQCQLPYRTKDKWYQRVELNNKKCFVCNSNGSGYSSSDSPCDWDLTDIRDYNPTECELKIGDEIHFYNDLKYSITEINHIESKFYLGESKSITFYFGENHKIKSVNGKKYDTIIIPKFDFAKCLVDAGFKIADDCLYVGKSFDDALIWFNSSTGRLNVGMYIKPTPANAQIIVSMANLAKGIK